jgi:hypothetical protein
MWEESNQPLHQVLADLFLCFHVTRSSAFFGVSLRNIPNKGKAKPIKLPLEIECGSY